MPYQYKRTAEGEYKCPYCDYSKQLQSTVHMHIKAKHSGTFKFKCDHCDYETISKQCLDNHLYAKHPSTCEKDDNEVKCPHEGCKYTCRTKGHLRSHYLLKHLSEQVNALMTKKEECIGCTSCQGTFKSKPSFIYHCVNCLPDSVADNENHCIGLAL
jgi:KRAB domain-containing zinc finger protein